MRNTNLIVPLCLLFPARRSLLLLVALVLAYVVIPGCGHRVGAQNNHTVARPPGPFEIRLPTRSFTPAARLPNWPRLFGKPDSVRAHAIVQLFEIPDAQTRAALSAAGIALGQPLTGRAYLATVKRDVQSTATVMQKIRWADSFSIKDKLASELRRAAWARRVPHRMELVVKLFPDADFTAAAIRGARDLGGNMLGEAQAASVFTVSLPVGRERDLARFDDIRFIEPMLPPGQGESDRARAHVHAGVAPIPAGRPDGSSVVIGVFDGQHVFITHPDFGTRALQGDTGTYTHGSHPTMTAGMIAGDGSQSLSQGASSPNQWRGIAPAAFIRSYNYLVPGTDPVANYLNHVTKAVQTDGVVVLNNSCGGLVSDSLVHRYPPQARIDGLPGEEGTFNMCSFWIVEALTRAGLADAEKLDHARLLFERVLGYANHLGLYSEQTGPQGEALGNFPQAFMHLALISAAFNLDRMLGSQV